LSQGLKTAERLYREDRVALQRFLRRKVRESSDVEEISQEAFLRLHQASGEQHLTNPRAFLFRTALNLVIDRFRSARLRFREVDHADAEHEPALQTEGLEQTVSQREWLSELSAVIQELPPKCRQVFVMHKIEQMSHAEIAKELNITVRTVEYHMTKAFLYCRKKLQHFAPES